MQRFSFQSSFSNPHPRQKQYSQGLGVSLSFESHYPLLQRMYLSLSVKNQRSRLQFLSFIALKLSQDSLQCLILSETGRLLQWCFWFIFKQRLHNLQVKKQSVPSACNINTTFIFITLLVYDKIKCELLAKSFSVTKNYSNNFSHCTAN